MLERIIRFAIEQRVLVILLVLGAATYGAFAFQRLPIDAVPDITNNQIQINVEVPGLSLNEVEKQVTFPIETALAGIPGLQYTRSLSRNGFTQVTAVFDDEVDIYFARQQVNERLGAAQEDLPPGAEPLMGPITTGLGEVFMWSVQYDASRRSGGGVQQRHTRLADRRHLSDPGRRAAAHAGGAGRLPAHDPGLGSPRRCAAAWSTWRASTPSAATSSSTTSSPTR